MPKFTVQREYTQWETQVVEADTHEQAREIADNNPHAYQMLDETFELTGDYWIRNNDTLEDRTDF